MGPSGSGKSTLVNMVAGLDRPTEGEVWFNGARIDLMSEAALARLRRRRVGVVFQFFICSRRCRLQRTSNFRCD
jgi:putative ABC transport system ATP-binding protein